ncbi:DUF72 domain-containing protein [Vibrio porteresiae]|uniref:DUF72 domain-containing protein n=1 Tax=Vibrio porteresiae DSM 19223 TaxID=1123496 RepID=A0ABZ0QGF8_9VIBR|nr:DUF72 domain-containing protein [Vibrio porteresiae]WPC75287.1 DUF72 domain-containing protein [Vibrio porteresiae DSM 19223]
MRLGLTMWSHSGWQSEFYGSGTSAGDRLARYAEVFNTVEGNTTFYASPAPHTVLNWRDATPDEFRFTFKLPKAITHENRLRNSTQLLTDFLTLMEPLHHKIGMWTIQLPAAFGPEDLAVLYRFCQQFPKQLPLGLEVRHPLFFAKGDAEKELNQWLIEQDIDRIIMDSRPVFSASPTDPVVLDAQQKKPKVPVHAIATAQHPMIRFIGHPDLDSNLAFFTPWLNKLPEWIAQGKQPYLMIHTPDNLLAPKLAQTLYKELQNHVQRQCELTLPDLSEFPAQKGINQLSMF